MTTLEILNALEDSYIKKLSPFKIYKTFVHPASGAERLSILTDGLLPSTLRVLNEYKRDYMVVPSTVDVYNPELDNDETVACLELIVY